MRRWTTSPSVRPSGRWPRSCIEIVRIVPRAGVLQRAFRRPSNAARSGGVSRMKDKGRLAMQKLLLATAVGLAAVFPSGHALAGKDLDAVKARGVLICGVAAGGPARLLLAASQGQWKGP